MLGFSRLVLILTILLGGISNAYAYREICGDGLDNDGGGGELLCPAPDQDNDDYASDGTGRLAGTDCDDTNRYIYPGITTGTGCGAGQVHTCQSSGSYTSCIALSAFTANSGSGNNYWISSAGSTSGGCGAYGSPCDWRCFSNNALGCYHAPVAGDGLIMRGGTYNSTWTDSGTVRMFYVFNADGTSSDLITLMSAPGETAIIAGVGVSPTEVIPVNLVSSNYWLVSGLTIHGGYSNSGIIITGGTNTEVRNNTIYDIDGIAGGNNLSGVKFAAAANNVYIHHNLFYDNYERAAPTNQNNVVGVTGFDSNTLRVNNNVIYTTVVNGAGLGIKIKHGFPAATGNEILNNLAFNLYQSCLGNNTPGIEIAYNRWFDCNLQNSGTSMLISDQGGYTEFHNIDIHNNTIINSSSLEANPTTDYAAIGNPAWAYYENVVIDNKGSYPTDGTNGFMRICNYCSNAIYTDVVTGGKISFDDNCYYNPLSTPLLFDLFSDSGSGVFGQNYFGLASWQTTGYDSGSHNEDPDLDIYDMATSTNCSDKGWRTGATPPPAPADWGILSNRFARGHR